MKIKLKSILVFAFIFSICACNKGNNSNSTPAPKNEVQEIFYQLTNNNFTLDITDSFYDLGNNTRNEKYYYTEYSLQAEGDFGFSGIAQGNEVVFKYTLEDNEVVVGSPLINPSNGVRYESIFEYTYGMSEFDYTILSNEKDENGYYTYEFGINANNDKIMLPIFTRMSPTSIPPEEVKFKIIKDVITFDIRVISYDFDGDDIPEGIDTIQTIVYDIGKTENLEIKQYLDDEKTSKEHLDLRFYKLFHPYLFSQNYTIDLDGTDIYSEFKFTEYCTEEAVYDYSETINSGYMLNQGVVTNYNIIDGKVNILSTPMKDESSYYTAIYGDVLTYTLNDLSYSNLVGYKDDENDNVYYLTDSYAVYILSYLCYTEVYEENYCDKVKLEIINDETNEFKLTFEMYNKKTNRDLGIVEAKFYDLNNTKIPAVSNYLSLGDNPTTQTKTNLENVLNKFRSHNYSMDFNTGSGLAKYYYTNDYMHAEIYGYTSQNFGFVKTGDSIFEYKLVDNVVTIDDSIDYGTAYTLPGLSNAFMALDDFGYISTIDDELYNLDNYEISSIYGQSFWSIKDVSLVYKIFNYYFATPKDILPTGVGLIVKDDGDNSKLSFYLTYVSSDGQYNGYSYLTYYDIGTTSHSTLEDYINNL